MKKNIISLAIILGFTLGASAQNRGLFDRGPQRETYDYYDSYENRNGAFGLALPTSHGQTDDESAPLGSGALLLIGFGAAYAGLRRKNQK